MDRLLRLAGTAALAAAAVIHLVVMAEHYTAWPASGWFFLLLGATQAGLALVLLHWPALQVALIGLPVNGGALLIWALSRTVGMPIGPQAGQIEPAGRADVLSAGLEALVVGILVLLLVPSIQRWLRRPLGQYVWWPTAAVAVLMPALLTPSALTAPSHHDNGGNGAAAAHQPGENHDTSGQAPPADDASSPGAEAGAMHGGTDPVGLDKSAPTAVANLGVQDQQIDGRTMTVGAAEVNGSPGWVVVRSDNDGKPGKVVAAVRRLNGQHGDEVAVPFTQPVTTGVFWVSLHRDLGQQQKLEIGAADELLESGGTPLLRRVILTVPT